MGDCNTRTFHRLHLVPPNYDTVASDTPIWVAPDMILDVRVGPDGAIWITTPSTIYRYWDSGRPPVASFTAAPNPIIVGATVTLDASASSDPDGQITSYAWNFGDLMLGSGQVASHVYTTAGTYNVSLTVTDNESFTATAYRNIVVQLGPPGPPGPPVDLSSVWPFTLLAVVVLGAILLVWRARRRRRPEQPPPPPM
jgi:PKD repeat protein